MSLERALGAIESLRSWLREAARPGGDFERHGQTYRGLFKAPVGFASVGLNAEAGRATDLLQSRFMHENGDFSDPPGSPADPHGAPSLDYFYPYRPSWILLGTHRLGRYDVALPVGKFLFALQHETGGLRAHPASDYCHICGTAQAGVAALAAGRLDFAERAADFLATAAQRQPEEDRIYYLFDPHMKPVKNWPQDVHGRWLQRGSTGQCSYMAALPAGLLAQMHLLTSKRAYLEAALRYYHFVREAADDVFDNPAAGKLAWSAALMYRITGDPAYRRDAWRAVEPLIRTVEGTPAMHVKDFYPDFSRQPPAFTYEVAFEQAFWLCELVKNLTA